MEEQPAGPVGRVEARLRQLGYEGPLHRTEDTIFTVEDASRSVGAPAEHILKSLLVRVDRGPLALVLLSGPNRVDLKKAKALLGARTVTLADPETVVALTGFRPGGVPPLGYEEQPPTLLDQDLFAYPVVWAAAGDDHTFFPVAPETLREYTGGARADVRKA